MGARNAINLEQTNVIEPNNEEFVASVFCVSRPKLHLRVCILK